MKITRWGRLGQGKGKADWPSFSDRLEFLPLLLSFLSAVISLSKVLSLWFKADCYTEKLVINQPGLVAFSLLRNCRNKATQQGLWGSGHSMAFLV